MSFDIIAYGVPPSLSEVFQARDTPASELPELSGPPIGLEVGLSEDKRRRGLYARQLARKAEEAEAKSLGEMVEDILRSVPQYKLMRVVKRNGRGWHLLMEYKPNGSVEGIRDVHLAEEQLGGPDGDRDRLDRLWPTVLETAVLEALRQQDPMRSTG